ncbi:flagellar biosynthesis anti-sigma factor FlgM [Nitrosovibrio tenuis]|uniref:Negative regulator of flagellin synthesis n=1 Tax=Nitrosovibrio tenuis TaxID=1233 RepID=A0A1H7J6Y1_9PROT|nr:flagellar biosynthesis anti-sigma factor FlgM [Nitrosovibrio tenuis]SEK70543.1 anti-sigma-28 factor, FlgM family [Nitrosovibrio tenuis]
MKIDNSIKTTAAVPGDISSAKSLQRAEITAKNAQSSSSDSVQLSAQLKNIERNLSNGEVFDTARVEEIKQAISEGRFTVNPEKVADRLLETVHELLRTRQG